MSIPWAQEKQPLGEREREPTRVAGKQRHNERKDLDEKTHWLD